MFIPKIQCMWSEATRERASYSKVTSTEESIDPRPTCILHVLSTENQEPAGQSRKRHRHPSYRIFVKHAKRRPQCRSSCKSSKTWAIGCYQGMPAIVYRLSDRIFLAMGRLIRFNARRDYLYSNHLSIPDNHQHDDDDFDLFPCSAQGYIYSISPSFHIGYLFIERCTARTGTIPSFLIGIPVDYDVCQITCCVFIETTNID